MGLFSWLKRLFSKKPKKTQQVELQTNPVAATKQKAGIKKHKPKDKHPKLPESTTIDLSQYFNKPDKGLIFVPTLRDDAVRQFQKALQNAAGKPCSSVDFVLGQLSRYTTVVQKRFIQSDLRRLQKVAQKSATSFFSGHRTRKIGQSASNSIGRIIQSH